MTKIVNHLYNNTVDLVFEDFKHLYSVDNKPVNSVTKILGIISKPALVPWAAKITTEWLAERLKPGVAYDEIQIKQMLDEAKRAHYNNKTTAGDVGTLVHKYLEQVIKKEQPEPLIHEEARNASQRFMDWVEKNKVEFLTSEQPVFSKEYNFCGTLDFICKMDGRLMLGDIKTSNQISRVEYGAQLMGYLIARQEEYPAEEFGGAILVRVGKKQAEFETWEITEEMKLYKEVFFKALELSNAVDKVVTKIA